MTGGVAGAPGGPTAAAPGPGIGGMPARIAAYFRDVLGKTVVGPPVLLSSTNSLVYRVVTRGDGAYLFKVLRHPGVDLEFVQRCHRALAGRLRVQAIVHTDGSRRHFDGPVQVSEFLDGRDYATLIEQGAMSRRREETLAEFLHEVVRASRAIALPAAGYGIYRLTEPLFPTFDAFVEAFVERYVGRFVELFGADSGWSGIRTALLDVYRRRVRDEARHFGVVPLDTNLRNVLCLDGDDRPALLNLPVLAYSELRNGVGAVTAHLRGSRTHAAFLARVRADLPDVDASPLAVLFFETLTLVAVLSFYCRQGREGVESAVSWGYRIPFRRRIAEHLAALTAAGGPAGA